jgi:hypothetical protein
MFLTFFSLVLKCANIAIGGIKIFQKLTGIKVCQPIIKRCNIGTVTMYRTVQATLSVVVCFLSQELSAFMHSCNVHEQIPDLQFSRTVLHGRNN